jgi:hypothetical protein
LRTSAVDTDLEPQHFVPPRDPKQPIDRVLDLRVMRVEESTLIVADPFVVITERDDRMPDEVIEHEQRQHPRQERSRGRRL